MMAGWRADNVNKLPLIVFCGFVTGWGWFDVFHAVAHAIVWPRRPPETYLPSAAITGSPVAIFISRQRFVFLTRSADRPLWMAH